MNTIFFFQVTCSKCRKQYVGKTEQELRQRHYGHRREIETGSSPLGKHFAQGCGYTSWRFQVNYSLSSRIEAVFFVVPSLTKNPESSEGRLVSKTGHLLPCHSVFSK